MLDAATTLALAIHANRGAYAVLIGSGVSRPAGIPTGHEIVLDLVRRVARLETADDPADPGAWYRDRFGKEPEYSDLLARLAPTPAERSALLRAYFEPSDEAREEGLKTPTAAHRAIARLVQEGWVRLILTTNFDRLMESALAELDVRTSIIDSPDDILGAPPVGHALSTLVKLHGDYLDTRIRNTVAELGAYDPAVDAFLDRVFDEYGLVVVGWSAAYDIALRVALTRVVGNRYSTFWLARGAVGDEAAQLIERRRALVLRARDADEFFGKLLDSLHALDDLAQGAPVSVRMAVATEKRLLPRPEDRIRLSDLVQDATERARDATARIVDMGTPYQLEPYQARLHDLEEAGALTAALMATGCRWGDAELVPLWQRTLQRLGTWPVAGGVVGWLLLRRYPAAIALYGGGMGALAGRSIATATALLLTPVLVDNERRHAADALPVGALLDLELMQRVRLSETGNPSGRYHTPANDHLHAWMRPLLHDLIPDDEEYSDLFDRFEYLLSLAITQHAPGRGLLGGRWSWRHAWGATGRSAASFVKDELEVAGDRSALVTSGLVPSAERGLELVEALRTQVRFLA